MKATDGKKTAHTSVPMSVEMREQIEAIADEREWTIAQTTRRLIAEALAARVEAAAKGKAA